MDLLQKNKEMLLANKYNTKDTMQLSRIASLINPNDYDLYLIACALCNYDIPEKAEARDLRMQLFIKTNGSRENYEHQESDYGKLETKLKCTNTGKTNKYGLYEYGNIRKQHENAADLSRFRGIRAAGSRRKNKRCKAFTRTAEGEIWFTGLKLHSGQKNSWRI